MEILSHCYYTFTMHPLIKRLLLKCALMETTTGYIHYNYPYLVQGQLFPKRNWLILRAMTRYLNYIERERKEGELFPIVLFVVTNTKEHSPKEIFKTYTGRGNMENFIKEGKNGFFFGRLSCHSFDANAARLQTMILVYNLNNLMRRLCMPEEMAKNQIDTLRCKIIKFGSKIVSRSRLLFVKGSSTYVAQKHFIGLIENIQLLKFGT